jgi:hypothetical protein
MLRGRREALLTAQKRQSPQPIPTQENLSELLMVTDAKLSLQNRRHDAMGGCFGLLVRGLRSGDSHALAPTTATPIATATMTNLLMLRGMIASTYRTIVALYRPFDLRRCDLHHSFAFLAARVLRLPTPKPD